MVAPVESATAADAFSELVTLQPEPPAFGVPTPRPTTAAGVTLVSVTAMLPACVATKECELAPPMARKLVKVAVSVPFTAVGAVLLNALLLHAPHNGTNRSNIAKRNFIMYGRP